MKTIVNKLRFLLVLGFIALAMSSWSQAVPYINKMSITTQLFLEEMAGNITFDHKALPAKSTSTGVKPLPKPRRPIAAPDTIDGKVYIDATIRVTNNTDIEDLQRLGVIIQCKFDKGLLTAAIPIDMIDDVAAIEGVKRINVSAIMRPLTNRARQTTNVDDVLTHSADAIAAGLPSIFDGSGVILGIIDTGIDFQHKAFTDKNGNTRIKGVYCYDGDNDNVVDWAGSGTLPTTDDNSEDHGTHTSSIAGGSSVIISGSTVTVTDNHANATYGGMAPGADLYLAATRLSMNHILNSFQSMANYANAQNKPLVVNNSWGSAGWYSRNGYSDISDVIEQYFGDSHPNHICLFASGNEAGRGLESGLGGGMYVTGTSSQQHPLGTIVRSNTNVENSNLQYYYGLLANAWTRATDATGIGINIHVINKSTGALFKSYSYSSTVNNSQNNFTLEGLNLSVWVLFDYVGAQQGRHQVAVYTEDYTYTSTYVFAIEVYPIGGSSSIVDIYGGDYTYLISNVNTSNHTWVAGTDDMSVGDECMDSNVISVGSYVTRNGATSTGDISYFSSYATTGSGPTGVQHPWITAPGEVITSAFNHYVSSSNHTVTAGSSNGIYGDMSGTSMATPAVAGIVALWLQAAQQVGKDLTLSDVKNIMAETAIHDQWTNGTNASHFGNGKINALGGIEYILREYAQPMILATPSTITFEGAPGGSYTETVTVGGIDLTGNITATLNDANGVYSINTTSFDSNGGNLVITYSPSSQGTHNATITLSSQGIDPVTVTINGRARIVTDAIVADATNENNTLPVYGTNHNRTQTNQMLYPVTEFTGKGMEGKTIKKITFYPRNGINFRGGSVTVKLANMPANTSGYTSNNPTRKTATFVTVKTLSVPSTAQTNLTEWVFEDLTGDFTYEGGDLLIEVTTTTGTAADTYFYGKSYTNSYPSYYSYIRSGRTTSAGQRFLPKVKFEWDAPFIEGEVAPNTLTFTDVIIGRSQEQTVTVTNTGNMPFTPVIDTTNLPAEFTVTGGDVVAVGGSLGLTVTYTPTDEGPHNGSFTVTIGDATYTVTVTGNGIVVNSTLFSNEVMVPVYKSDIRANGDTYIFSESDVLGDIVMNLEYPANSSSIEVLAKADEPILRYDLHHKIGEDGNWTYPNGTAVATATHNGNSYVVNSETFTFPQDATEMWISMNDSQLNNATEVTYYVPVTVANGKVTTGEPNTYGAPFAQSQLDPVSIEVRVGGVKSSVIDHYGNHTGEWEGPNGVNYCVYMPVVTVLCQQLNGTTHVPYLYRAWLLANDFVDYYNYAHDPQEGFYGTTVKQMPYLLAEKGIDDIGDPTYVTLGEAGDTYEGQNTFGAPVDDPGIVIAVRVYYQRADELSGHMLRAGGGYGFGQGSGRGDGIQTGINELINGKQVVDVQYVNTLGMQSSEPFDGVNIVITRYSDGSTSTTKVVK